MCASVREGREKVLGERKRIRIKINNGQPKKYRNGSLFHFPSFSSAQTHTPSVVYCLSNFAEYFSLETKKEKKESVSQLTVLQTVGELHQPLLIVDDANVALKVVLQTDGRAELLHRQIDGRLQLKGARLALLNHAQRLPEKVLKRKR